jgi:hypothetical protein
MTYVSTRKIRFLEEIFHCIADLNCQGVRVILMHVCVAEYNASLDGEATPEDKAQIMGGNLLWLLAVHP